MNNKISVKMVVAFSLIVFLIVTLAVVISSLVVVFLSRFNVFTQPKPLILLGWLGIISIIVSTVIAQIIGKKVLSPISDLNKATKEVAKGNFSTRLSESSWTDEIREMAHSFNIMTYELGNIETLRDDFISNVSHEFKTPISAIEGYATLLQDDELSDEERKEYIHKILISTKRLSSLSGNILQITELENQKILPLEQKYCLDEQIRQTILLFEYQWTKKNITLDINLDNITYIGSKDLLAQVWQNILGNAIKFSHQNGTIQVTLTQTNKEVLIKIKDNGIGMSEEVKNRVFEKFYQGDSSHYSEGNGLGLALVKRIIDICEGTIEISSHEGVGTDFIVKLPK
ncbi:HAMP domain protein [Clostridium sporogenes]|uniref:Heme sensor protein HssS n=1 Tax=Clostridium sporogenes TaxID=1509 RepID=A0A1L3NCD0_CLOSG|nr:HAMP domain-containing sensor histidine kinase [Clostridium sporogenes]APH13782.1 HAMP domain protein [Clostridium sporogenes]